jgi:hypothetical protein
MDPTIQDPCGADAEWCFITEDLLKEEFERQYPDATPLSSIEQQGIGDQSLSQWINEDTVRIAEYFYAEYEPTTLHMFPGNIVLYDDAPEMAQVKAMGYRPIKSREVNRRKIRWCRINGFEVLEDREWAGKWIPVVRVVGNEFEVDGRVFVSGIVRNAKDAQRMYNYWVSQEAEMLALAPKAPFIGYGGQFEGYEQQWKTANVNNWPYLEVNPDVTDGQGSVLPLPQRAQPPLAQTGLIQAKMGASDDIKSTTGQYDSSLGATSNERSGRAILAREKQGDTGTYHYVDNLARAVRHITRQIVDLVPKIYDTQRIARIVGIDGDVKAVKIDPTQPEPMRKVEDEMGNVIEKIYNPSVGKYDVCVTTGPSYMTKRQEAMDAMSQILQGNPQLWAIAGDLFVKNMDWPGAQEMAARFAKIIDPKVMEGEDQSPEMQMAKMQLEALTKELNQVVGMLQRVEQSIEAQEVQIKAYDAETKRISAVQAGMTPEQIQDIVMGTIAAAMDTGDIVGRDAPMERQMPAMDQMPPEMGGMLPEMGGMPPEMPPGGPMQ